MVSRRDVHNHGEREKVILETSAGTTQKTGGITLKNHHSPDPDTDNTSVLHRKEGGLRVPFIRGGEWATFKRGL